MRRDPDFFGETELVLVYMAKRLKHALAIEKIFDEGGVDYFLETGSYLSGLLFRTSKVGVYFYTTAPDEKHALALLAACGFRVEAKLP